MIFNIFSPFVINIIGLIVMLLFYIIRNKIIFNFKKNHCQNYIRLKQFFKLEQIMFIFFALLLIAFVLLQSNQAIFIGGWFNKYGIAIEDNILLRYLYIACVISSIIYVINQKINSINYYINENFFLFFILLCLYGILFSSDLFNLYVWFEILMFSSIALLIKSHFYKINIILPKFNLDKIGTLAKSSNQKIKNDSIIKYTIFNIVTGSIILLLVGIIYRISGNLNLKYIYFVYDKNIEIITFLLFVILAIKSGIIISSGFISYIYDDLNKCEKIIFLSFISKINLFCMIKILFFINDQYLYLYSLIRMLGFYAIIKTLINNNIINMISINSSAIIFALSGLDKNTAIVYSIISVVINSIILTPSINNSFVRYMCFFNIIPIPPFFSFFYKINIISILMEYNIMYLCLFIINSVFFCYKVICFFNVKNNSIITNNKNILFISYIILFIVIIFQFYYIFNSCVFSSLC